MSALRRFESPHERGVSTILVGSDALKAAAPEISAWCQGRRVFLITSEQVGSLFEDAVRTLLGSSAAVETLIVPDGEEAKSVGVADGLWNEMLERGGKRDSRVIALGGGSVGDVAGFVAACFLRGVELAQIPTTLLAQVDASVGGKTAVDLPAAKNIVGAFHPPTWVIADTDTLTSLPQGELLSGLVEVVKMAAVLDASLFSEIEERLDSLLQSDPRALAWAVGESVRMKLEIVEQDPEESGVRRLLNFGHTLGHALETVLSYGSLRHGEAVAHGMRFALRLGSEMDLGGELPGRLESILDRMPLPPLPKDLSLAALLDAMRRDKKSTEFGTTWVLAERVGRGLMVDSLRWEQVGRTLEAFLASADE
jgi:3-dehydroquinate synthase